MLEKFTEAVFAYCFAILDGFSAFLERARAVVSLSVPLFIMAAVHLLLPRWVEAGIWASYSALAWTITHAEQSSSF